jgi:adenine-specific DNA-methyltransferase
MTTIEVRRTELVWPGKYNEDGTLKEVPRVTLPLQVIESVNESRATREAKKAGVQGMLFEVYEGKEGDTFEEGWKNKLVWGDNLLVMGSLLEKFAGKVDLIYIDPPFATGADFSFTTEVGESGDEISKEQSLIEEKAYWDTWGRGIDSYLSMVYDRLFLMRDLLTPTGLVYVHCDSRVNYLMRAMLDEVFGKDNLRNEVIWCYRGGGTPEKDFAQKHDVILRYSKGADYYFDVDPVRIPYSEASTERLQNKANVFRGDKVYRNYEPNKLGKHPEDWWTIQPIMPSEKQERSVCYYPTQKPVELLQRIIDSSAPPNGLVLDAFCGSGTTMVVAEGLRVVRGEKAEKSLGLAKHRRRWIGCDLGRFAVHTARKRLLEIEGCRPFEVLNLGKYERQYWQGVTFGEQKDKLRAEQALYEYLAFILKLYGAQPLSGMTYLHGKKVKAMVHIGMVDAPVTIAEIVGAVDECTKVKQKELHVLGWEWEMGLQNLIVAEANKRGVKLLLLQIPREVMEQQAAAKGDVRFFELAYLEAEIKQVKKLSTQVALKTFVIPNSELIPDEVRDKVKKWSDYIDYWAVDWDFQDDTFMQGWVAYRTRNERKLTLRSDVHTYERSGKYCVLIKVIDIFGNDTSRAFNVEVK